jgi:5-methylcytosine-specific restriction endonuclease McrA
MNRDARIEQFYTRAPWRKCRASFLASRDGLCEVCLSKGLIVPAVEVHHKVELTPSNIDDVSVTLNWDNLMALCESCHDEQHRKKRWRADNAGHIVIER